MDIIYEKAVPADLDELCSVIKRAVEKMDSMGIFQWDEVYPDRATLQLSLIHISEPTRH